MNIALSFMKRSMADKLPKAWLTEMKKNTPMLEEKQRKMQLCYDKYTVNSREF